MQYSLIKDVIDLLDSFESEGLGAGYQADIEGFKQWIVNAGKPDDHKLPAVQWEGKEKGRSIESVINTQLLHLSRYARLYAKAAIVGSALSTPEEFIYLINLKAFGQMTKMELIRMNVHEKSLGVQIIDRLVTNKFVRQFSSESDRRARLIAISELGEGVLEESMDRIRKASLMVTGDLNYDEKLLLAGLLGRLESFHAPQYSESGTVKRLRVILDDMTGTGGEQ